MYYTCITILNTNGTGAWDKVDDEVDTSCSSSNEFEDDYDPKAEADLVGKAFGDYKDAKKRKKEAGQTGAAGFEDTYDPGVDVNDPLAGAFGDGFRTSKPVQVQLNLCSHCL